MMNGKPIHPVQAEGTLPTAEFHPSDKAAFARLNQRRIALINKEFDQGLSDKEKAELEQLQAAMDRFLEENMPLPFDILEQAKECAKREGLLGD
jgi:hypothetical protein